MTTFRHAIVKRPCHNFSQRLTTVRLSVPSFYRAVQQHSTYVDTLKRCGLTVHELPADNRFPDSTFVEDTAVLLPDCAIITRPWAPSRRGEIIAIHEVLARHFETIETIKAPGTLDGGDVMIADNRAFIGLTERTNQAGADQLKAILARFDISSSFVHVRNSLHLKSDVAYLNSDTIVVTQRLASEPVFQAFRKIIVPPLERYAANCVNINGNVLVTAEYTTVCNAIKKQGFSVIEINMSEFKKMDGGLSCLSLRW